MAKFATRYVAAPVVLLLGARVIWGLEAGRRLDRVYGELRAAGVPLETKNFLEPVLPDQSNALVPVLHAIGALELTEAERGLVSGEGKSLSMPYETEYTAGEEAQLDGIFARMGPAFGDLDRAMAVPEAQWGPGLKSAAGGSGGMDEGVLSSPEVYEEVRFLAHATVLAARRAHERGDDSACLHGLEQSLALARITDANPTLYGHETAIGIRTETALGVQQFLGDLRIDGADRAAAERLVEAFGDDRSVQQSEVRAFQFELAYHRDTLPTEAPLSSSWLLKPLVDTTVARLLEMDASLLPAAAAPIYDAHLLPKLGPTPPGALSDMVLPPLNGVMETFERAMILQSRHLADGRATAVLLAARMFEEERHRQAQGVSELRGYLGSAPRDPFAKDGSALRYRLDADGPTVWSVGEDGVDNHGHLARSAGRVRIRYSQRDLVYGAAWMDAMKAGSEEARGAAGHGGAAAKGVSGGAVTRQPSR
ncbi:MAG TPA: hypothetical protein VH253_07280 [Phycisphaerae bacterium]|nr:hypothetical protein [Phycisphaerae bacterium]